MEAIPVGNDAERRRLRNPPRARIVVGIDGSENARCAFHWALDEARLRHAAVDVVHAWQLPYQGGYPIVGAFELPAGELEASARQLLNRAVDRANTKGLEVEPILVCGSAGRALLDAAKGADLLVVGSRGRGGFAGLLLGSVSQKVVHHATCPVVVIPAATY